MQRFKKFTMVKGNADAHGQPAIFGRRWGYAFAHPAASASGKFIYGANGTLTQAARWRNEAFDAMGVLRYNGNPAWAAIEVLRISNLLQAARWGGWKLP